MTPIRMERLESGVRTIIEFNQAFNRHDVPAMMQLISEDCTFESTSPAPDGTVFKGKVAITRFYQDFFTQSPHAQIKIEETFGFGYRCIMRWRYDWQDTAGNPAHVRGVDLYRVQNGLIQEMFSYLKG